MLNSQWKERKRPARLERRYVFENYDHLREFLDEAADLSEAEGYYPDMGFGRDYLNVIIHAEEGCDSVSDAQRRFASLLDQRCPAMAAAA